MIEKLNAQTLKLINEQEVTFFNRALDEELNRIITDLKYQLTECSHNLIEIEKQIIDYLNQIKIQGKFLEKLRKLKYLRDQFLIDSETDIKQVISNENLVLFETRTSEPLKLSIDFLKEEEKAFEAIKRVARKFKNRQIFKQELADSISDDYLENDTEEEIMINLEELKNQFMGTSDNLFHFIMNYDFLKEVDFNQRVTIFCQVVSLYDEELEIKNDGQEINGVEFAMITPK